MRKRTQARECALQMLYQFELNKEPFDELFEHFWSHYPEATQEVRDFAEKLAAGTAEKTSQIDSVISRYAENWNLARMAVIDRNILRFAAYELLYCSDIPPKVTINEAVNIAKKYSQEDSGKFVNGILDKISHSGDVEKVPGEAGSA